MYLFLKEVGHLFFFSRLCGLAYNLFQKTLGDQQYVNGIEHPSNRLFNQFHASQTDEMKKEIVREIVKDKSNVRVLFATSALGMGVDIPHVENVDHIGPPSTMESYMQQIGRAGRSDEQATATIYWNRSDIGANIKHLSDEIRLYCRSNGCLRAQLVGHFGFPSVKQDRCCSVCEEMGLSQDVCSRLAAIDLPTPKIVRYNALSRPLLLQELNFIFKRWQPDPAVLNLFEVEPFSKDICERIADDIQFVTDAHYLAENFDMWDRNLANAVFHCLMKHS